MQASLASTEKKLAWFDVRWMQDPTKDSSGLLLAVFNGYISVLFMNRNQYGLINMPSRMGVAVFITKREEVKDIKKSDIIISTNEELLHQLMDEGYSVGLYSIVDNKESLLQCCRVANKFNYVVVKLVDETNIPLELILAETQKTDVKIIKEVATAKDGEIAFGVMEVGSHGILLSTKDVTEIFKLNDYFAQRRKGSIKLQEAEVEYIRHIGMGDRACIDTTSLLTQDEGIIVGSTSSGGILVCSETHYLPYMNLRPFRVNAGAVHSYVSAPNNRTEYLTDLEVGSEVLVVDKRGNVREVTVGRIKTEVRPLLLIQCKVDSTPINVIVQDDWHVRVMGADGKPKNVTTLKRGDKLLAFLSKPGRHVGIAVDETILEK